MRFVRLRLESIGFAIRVSDRVPTSAGADCLCGDFRRCPDVPVPLMGAKLANIVVCLALAFAQTASADGPSRTCPPNIVYILADDLGYGDVRCFNSNGKIATPYLDRLAADGMRFTDAHSSSAVCTPTRYGILTGRLTGDRRSSQAYSMGIRTASSNPAA